MTKQNYSGLTFKHPIEGDIITFRYNGDYEDVKAVFIKGKSGCNPTIKLLQDISYLSMWHQGETFKNGMLVDFLAVYVKTVNGKKYIKSLTDLWNYLINK